MTTRTRRPHYQERRAHADGWDIENRARTDATWELINLPSFYAREQYRIVPDADGWLPWYGSEDGKGPFEGNPMIDFVTLGTKDAPRILLQSQIGWMHLHTPCSDSGNVVLYRLHKEAAPAEPKWRVGRKLGRTIYENGMLVGTMDSAELARMVVDALNRYGQVLYVPHYRKECFVGPGYPKHNPKEYTAIQLYDAGARPVEVALWKRGHE